MVEKVQATLDVLVGLVVSLMPLVVVSTVQCWRRRRRVARWKEGRKVGL